MWTPVTVVLFMIIIMVIVPYLNLMLYISNHITPHIRGNISIAIPDTSLMDLPVVEVTSPPSRHAWMTAIEPMIRDKLLSDVVLPGTHSSASYSVDSQGTPVDGSFITNVMVHSGFKRQAARWLHTQDIDVFQQLEDGIRALHIKVIAAKHRFFTYHGLTGDYLSSIFQQIRKFTDSYKGEIVVVYLDDLKEMTLSNEVKVMSLETRRKLLDVISSILRKDLVPFRHRMPTVGELLKTRKTVIVVCDLFDTEAAYNSTGIIWPAFMMKTLKSDFSRATDLFLFISDLLKRPIPQPILKDKISFTFATLSPSVGCQVTAFLHSRLSLCMSLSLATISGYIVGSYIYSRLSASNNSFSKVSSRKKKHFCVFFSSLALFGFLYTLLQCIISTVGEKGCNDALMELGRFTNTESEVFPLSSDIHSAYNDLHGLNSALTHWLSKPSLYKVNTIFVDDFQSSNIVQIAIESNRGSLRRRMVVVFIGSPLVGSRNIRSWFACSPSQISYLIASHDEGKVVTWSSISPESRVTFEEGQYPMDSQIVIFAGTPSGTWFQLYSGNLHRWIDMGHDLFIRASENRNGRGVAYISTRPDLVSAKCVPEPDEVKEALNTTKWYAKMTAANKNSKKINLS